MMRSTLRFLLAVVTATAMLVLAVLWLHDESLREVQRPPEPLWGAPERVPAQQSQTIALHLAWTRGVSVRAGTAEGTITAVSVKAGDRVDGSGSPYAVDAVPIAWLPGPIPLYRDIGAGMSGQDVDAVGAFLAARHLVAPNRAAGARVDGAFLRGVADYARAIGVPVPAAPDPVVFQRSWVVWLPPAARGRVSRVDIAIGDAAPEPGASIVEVGSRLSRGTVPRDPNTPTPLVARGEASHALVIGRRRVAWNGVDVPARAVALLDRAVAPGDDTVAVVALTTYPAGTFTVPAAALVPATNGDGVCVAHDTPAAPGRAQTARVRILGADETAAIVSGNLGGGRVLLDPGDMGVASCP